MKIGFRFVFINLKPIFYKNYIMTNCKSSADQLRELKNLLDEGVLTQEEFDAKKKQILGL